MILTRRDLLRGSLALAFAESSCRPRPKARDAVLAALVREIVVPDARAVVAMSQKLDLALKALADAPGVETARAARAAFEPALLAWKRAQCFRNGPMAEAFARVLFWPPREAAIAPALASTLAVDATFVANLGVDARGIYALEGLLFSPEYDETAALETPNGLRRRTLCAALGRNIAAAAANSAATLGDGSTFAAQFAAQTRLNLSFLVNQMSSSVEMLAVRRLGRVLTLEESHRLSAREIEGFWSGTSRSIVVAQLEGSERLFHGGPSGGIADLAEAVVAGVGKRVTGEYVAALAAVRALRGPLERVVSSDRPALVAAVNATKALERGLKTEVASALGVTTTFQMGDGD